MPSNPESWLLLEVALCRTTENIAHPRQILAGGPLFLLRLADSQPCVMLDSVKLFTKLRYLTLQTPAVFDLTFALVDCELGAATRAVEFVREFMSAIRQRILGLLTLRFLDAEFVFESAVPFRGNGELLCHIFFGGRAGIGRRAST